MDAQSARAEIERELALVLQSEDFPKGSRKAQLLQYLVEKELDGEAAGIKAYAIGVDVLHRPDDFDPNSDAIVRVEMGRLRAALDAYYAHEGQHRPLRIEIPRGRYRPRFVRQGRIDGPKLRRWLFWGLFWLGQIAIVALGTIIVIELW